MIATESGIALPAPGDRRAGLAPFITCAVTTWTFFTGSTRWTGYSAIPSIRFILSASTLPRKRNSWPC